METKNTQPPFPRYKERLKNKYLKDPTQKLSLDGRRWRLLNTKLDDFRDCGPILPGGQSGVSPVIFHGTLNHTSSRLQKKHLSREHSCFSKQKIRKQSCREYVAAVEEQLMQHPLSQYQNRYYKEHMDPQLFDKVVSVLDPDTYVNSASEFPTHTEEDAEEDTENSTKPNKEEVYRTKQRMSDNEEPIDWKSDKSITDIEKPHHKSPSVLQTNVNTNEEERWADTNQLNSMILDEDVREIVEHFRNCFASLGEENNMINFDALGHYESGLQLEKDADFEQNKMCDGGSVKHKYGVRYLHPDMWKGKTGRDDERKSDFKSQAE